MQGLVGQTLASRGASARRDAARPHAGGAFARRRRQQFVGGQLRHLDVQVDTVQQRARQAALVARHLVGRAAAGRLALAQVAARAGVHRGDELKARRKVGPARRAADGDAPALQRLAQGLQRGARELGQLVEEQHAAVGQRDFARARWRAPAHECHRAGRVVRCARGALAPARQVKRAVQAGDGGALQRLVVVHGRQQAGKALRQHRLAAAGRAHHQQRMAARGGNLQRPFDRGLAFHVGQIGVARLGRARGGGQGCPAFGRRCGVGGAHGQKLRHHVQQVARAVHGEAGHQGGLFGAARRQDQARRLVALAQRGGHGQRAAHGPQLARQRQLAGKSPASQARTVDLPAGGQDAQRDGQVEPPRILGQIGRRQVDGDALVVRKREAAVEQGAAHALARLLDRDLGQPDQGETGQAVGQVHLHRDRRRGQTQQRAALHLTQTHAATPPVATLSL